VHLVEKGNAAAGREVRDVAAEFALARLALHGEYRLATAHDHEVDLPASGVAQKTQFHPFAFVVLHPVTVLEENAGDEVFQPRRLPARNSFRSGPTSQPAPMPTV